MKTFSVWITGISGAGKTTLAKNINAILNSNQHASVILDGDEIRKKMSKDLGYSIEDRDENIRRIACISELLSHQNIITIVSVISPMKNQRAHAKEIYGDDKTHCFEDIGFSQENDKNLTSKFCGHFNEDGYEMISNKMVNWIESNHPHLISNNVKDKIEWEWDGELNAYSFFN